MEKERPSVLQRKGAFGKESREGARGFSKEKLRWANSVIREVKPIHFIVSERPRGPLIKGGSEGREKKDAVKKGVPSNSPGRAEKRNT